MLSKDLRTATAFTAMTATDGTFTGLLNTAATAPANQLRLYVDSSGVLRGRDPARRPQREPLTYTGTPTTRIVGRGWCPPPACSATATAPTPSPPA